jgi:hypothetical protein
VLTTLVGIRLLQEHYANKKNCWTLVVNKAFYAIQQLLKKQGKDLNQ